MSSNIFQTLFLSLLNRDLYNSNVGAFNVAPEVSETILIFLFFFLYSTPWQSFLPFFLHSVIILSSSSLIHSSASVIFLLIHSHIFFI